MAEWKGSWIIRISEVFHDAIKALEAELAIRTALRPVGPRHVETSLARNILNGVYLKAVDRDFVKLS